MRVFKYILTVIILIASESYSERVQLYESTIIRDEPNRKWVFNVDSEKLERTPSWDLSKPIPLTEEELMSTVRKISSNANDIVCSIDLRRVGEIKSLDGTSLDYKNKWFYVITWEHQKDKGDTQLRSMVILLDGTRVLPGIKQRTVSK